MHDLSEKQLLGCLRENPPALYQFLKAGAIFRPQIIGMFASWTDGQVNQAPKRLEFVEQVTSDFFPVAVVYDVERPNFAAGSIDKPEADFYNALRPGLDVRISFEGGFDGDQFPVNIKAQPIQNLISQCQQNGPLRQVFGRGMVLEYNQQCMIEAFLTRALVEGETPYTLRVTFHGIRLGCRNLGGLDRYNAIQKLMTDYKIDVSDQAQFDSRMDRLTSELRKP